MRVETNEWRPYGKIIYQKQNFIVKQVAMLPEKAAEYDEAFGYACCPIQSWQYTDLHKLFDDWRKQFAKAPGNGICKRIPCVCYPDDMTFRAAYLAVVPFFDAVIAKRKARSGIQALFYSRY